jgi:exopolysaccharide biosynthesis WecB/TagA/CpsF family protein
VRWALNRLYHTGLNDRVYGPTLMLEICRRAGEENVPVFLYGSTSEMLDSLKKNLLERFPALPIAGTMPSRFRRLSPVERDEVVATIRSSGAAITFVGIGCPRQEVWAFENRHLLSMPLVAVGAAFSFHAGTLAQAPRLLQDMGLEWAFRLFKEPRRLWRRYLLFNPLYLSLLLLQMVRLYELNPEKTSPPTQELLYG